MTTEPLGRSEVLSGDATMAALLAEYAEVLAREAALRREVEALRDELTRAHAAADDARQVKAAFMAHMNHKVRTPLNAIVGLAEQMLAGTLADEQRTLAENVRASGDHMAQMLGGILDFVELESNALALVHRPFALVEEVERALDAVAPFAAARHVELCVSLADATYVTVVGDAVRLRQLVFNIVSNAVRFGGAGDVEVRVGVDADADGARVTCEVRDHGPGFDAEALPRLLAGGEARALGLGLGLRICDRVCGLMGGGLAIENMADGGATVRFNVRLGLAGPVARERVDLAGRRVRVATASAGLRATVVEWLVGWNAVVVEEGGELVIADAERAEGLAADTAMVVLGAVGSRAVSGSPNVANVARPIARERLGVAIRGVIAAKVAATPAAAAAVVTGPTVDAGKLRILIAEDNPFNQRVILGALRRLGYAADVVMDGCAAVDAVAGKVYDLVLMDLMMPELDGVSATREICGRWPVGERPRIVAITAQATTEDHETCLAAGMTDFLTKPLDTQRLAAALQECPRRGA